MIFKINNTIKQKEKTEAIFKCLIENKIVISDLISFVEKSKDSAKATSIEFIEYASKKIR